MNLLIIRHGIAMDREEFAESGQSDDLRPLTAKGVRRMKQIAKGLQDEVGSVDRLGTSPLARAVETADIIATAYGIDKPEETTSLAPGAPFPEFEKWCAAVADAQVVAVVGHEPHLSSLATWLLTGRDESRLELRKGGACLIGFESAIGRDLGTLHWLLTPGQLRGLGG